MAPVSPDVLVAVGASAFTTDGWDAAKTAPKTVTLAKLVKIIFFLSHENSSDQTSYNKKIYKNASSKYLK